MERAEREDTCLSLSAAYLIPSALKRHRPRRRNFKTPHPTVDGRVPVSSWCLDSVSPHTPPSSAASSFSSSSSSFLRFPRSSADQRPRMCSVSSLSPSPAARREQPNLECTREREREKDERTRALAERICSVSPVQLARSVSLFL